VPVRRCLFWHAEVLSGQTPICVLTFQSENECIHLVIILNNWNIEWVFNMCSPLGGGGHPVMCRRRRSRHPHIHWVVWVDGGRRSVAAVARGSHLLHMGGRRSGAAAAGASHLLPWGRRSDVARGRRKPPVAVSGLPHHVQGVLANHCWPDVEKT
jgi:hypothetical protein